MGAQDLLPAGVNPSDPPKRLVDFEIGTVMKRHKINERTTLAEICASFDGTIDTVTVEYVLRTTVGKRYGLIENDDELALAWETFTAENVKPCFAITKITPTATVSKIKIDSGDGVIANVSNIKITSGNAVIGDIVYGDKVYGDKIDGDKIGGAIIYGDKVEVGVKAKAIRQHGIKKK